MKDYCIRATAANGQIRAFVVTSQGLVETSRRIHNTSATASAALGRTLTGAAIMGLLAGNEEDLLTISIKGNGGIGGILATSDGLGRVKGYVHNPSADLPPKNNGKLDVSGIVGEGTLTITKDVGLKEPYSGTLELVSGEIAEDITNYFAISEQIPTILSLGVKVDTNLSIKQAGGFLIQLMPFYEEWVIDELEKIIQNFPSVTTLLDEGKTPEDILEMLLGSLNCEITEKYSVEYYCNCDKERVSRSLATLQKHELRAIIEEDGNAEVNCHFCNTVYTFNKDELTEILNNQE